MGTVDSVQEEPIDPFNGDPADPAAGLDDLTEDAESDPLTEAERQDVLEDLSDLEIYQALLSPTGIRGLVIECEDCHEPHYFDWDLLRGNLRHLLSSGPPAGARAGLRPGPGPLRHVGVRPRLRRRRARHPDRGHGRRTELATQLSPGLTARGDVLQPVQQPPRNPGAILQPVQQPPHNPGAILQPVQQPPHNPGAIS